MGEADGSDASRVVVRRAMMDLLARREHSRRELLQKVARKFPDCGPTLEEEASRLAEEGLQSDARMAESFVRARTGRGQGPVRIRADLRARGVSDEEIDAALAMASVDWAQLAKEVALKRFGEALPCTRREQARQARFLQQRGFLFDHYKWLT